MEHEAKIRRTFGRKPAGDELALLVGFAIERPYQDKLRLAVVDHGPAAAGQLLRFITSLPGRAKISAEQFVLGYVPGPGDSELDALLSWNGHMKEALDLAMVDFKEDDNRKNLDEIGDRLLKVIGDIAEMASPRMIAWGIPASDSSEGSG